MILGQLRNHYSLFESLHWGASLIAKREIEKLFWIFVGLISRLFELGEMRRPEGTLFSMHMQHLVGHSMLQQRTCWEIIISPRVELSRARPSRAKPSLAELRIRCCFQMKPVYFGEIVMAQGRLVGGHCLLAPTVALACLSRSRCWSWSCRWSWRWCRCWCVYQIPLLWAASTLLPMKIRVHGFLATGLGLGSGIFCSSQLATRSSHLAACNFHV